MRRIHVTMHDAISLFPFAPKPLDGREKRNLRYWRDEAVFLATTTNEDEVREGMMMRAFEVWRSVAVMTTKACDGRVLSSASQTDTFDGTTEPTCVKCRNLWHLVLVRRDARQEAA